MEKYPSLVEGTGLENREVGDGAGVRIPLSPPLIFYIAGWSSLAARWAHNPKVVGSNPVFPTIYKNWGHSAAGRAPALHAGGQRFDPAWLHQLI